MNSSDAFAFYAFFGVFTTIGGIIASSNKTETRFNDPVTAIGGSIIFAFGFLMLYASIESPISGFISPSIGTAIVATALFFGGISIAALSKYRSYDLLGLVALSTGTAMLWEIGIFNPVIRGILQEIQTAQVF